MNYIYILWDTGCITRHTQQQAQAMAENKWLAPRIVKAAYFITEL